ncbi:MAG: hypothetical protein WCI04_04540 [archaeon]
MPEEIQRIVFVTHPLWPAVVPRYPIESASNILVSKQKSGVIVNIPTGGQKQNQQRRTPKEVQTFLENELISTIRKIKGNFLIVFVPTPTYQFVVPRVTPEFIKAFAEKSGFGNPEKLSGKRKKEFNKFAKHTLSTFFRVGNKNQRKARGVEKKFFISLANEFPRKVMYAKGNYGISSMGIAHEVFNRLAQSEVKISKKAVVVGMGAWAENCARYYSEEYAKLQGLRQTVSRKGSISIRNKVRLAKKHILRTKIK